MAKWMAAAVVLFGLGLSGCGGKKIVTITFPKKDGNSEYWVCDRDATNCHGKNEGDVEPTLYKPGLDTLSPPVQCDHGAAKMEIVVHGNQVEQIGYECAQPAAPTGLPQPTAPGVEGEDDSELPPPAVDAPTGLPPVVPAPEDEEEDEPAGDASVEQTSAPSGSGDE